MVDSAKWWENSKYKAKDRTCTVHFLGNAQCLNLLGMGRKKSEFFKNGVKPLLWTLLGTHSSNFIFGPILGPILGHFWAQTDKNWPTNQNGSFSTIFCVEIKGQLI